MPTIELILKAAVEGFKKGMADAEKQIKAFEKASKKTKEEVKKDGEDMGKGAEKSEKQMSAAFRKLENSMSGLGGRWSSVAGSFNVGVGIMIGAGVLLAKKLWDNIQETTKAFADFETTTKNMGISFGSDMERMTEASRKFSDQIKRSEMIHTRSVLAMGESNSSFASSWTKVKDKMSEWNEVAARTEVLMQQRGIEPGDVGARRVIEAEVTAERAKNIAEWDIEQARLKSTAEGLVSGKKLGTFGAQYGEAQYQLAEGYKMNLSQDELEALAKVRDGFVEVMNVMSPQNAEMVQNFAEIHKRNMEESQKAAEKEKENMKISELSSDVIMKLAKEKARLNDIEVESAEDAQKLTDGLTAFNAEMKALSPEVQKGVDALAQSLSNLHPVVTELGLSTTYLGSLKKMFSSSSTGGTSGAGASTFAPTVGSAHMFDLEGYKASLQGKAVGNTQQMQDLFRYGTRFAGMGYSTAIQESTKGQFIPSYQEGGLVPSTGMYQLHEGETVVPRAGAHNAGGVNITVNASVASDYDVERLSEQLAISIQRNIKRFG